MADQCIGKYRKAKDKGYGLIEPVLPDQALAAALEKSGKQDVFVPPRISQNLPASCMVQFRWRRTDKGVEAFSVGVFVEDAQSVARSNEEPPLPDARRQEMNANDPRPDLWRVDRFMDEQQKQANHLPKGEAVVVMEGPTGQQVPADTKNLGCADPVLGVRPGAGFSVRLNEDGTPKVDPKTGLLVGGELVEYAGDIQPGLGPIPDTDRNPYNFAAWVGPKPWEAEDPEHGGTHEKEALDRLSGVITVTLTARSPIFVPSSDDPSEFFSCHDGTEVRKAIPGSTVKGCVRSLFEALTNSRLGVSSLDMLGVEVDDSGKKVQRPALYRRRAPNLYRIIQMPNGATPGKAVRCEWEYLNIDSGTATPGNVIPKWRDHRDIPDGELSGAQVFPWRANTFWVGSHAYCHRKGKRGIAVLPTNGKVDLPGGVVDKFLEMRGHPHLVAHPKNVKNKKGSGYQNDTTPGFAPADTDPREIDKAARQSYETCAQDLFDLRADGSVYSLVHGFDDGKQLVTIGRNFNFLWPAKTTPAKLAEPFLARDEDSAALDGADPAAAVFGFIGNHREADPNTGRPATHPFRGRVRFTTFWATKVVGGGVDVQLMPLTAPAGTKAKSRPLYLTPGAGGRSGNWGEKGVALRGRKFYWHQKPDPHYQKDGIAKQHSYDLLKCENGPEIEDKMLPKPIRPLGEGSTFQGEVHFANLTRAELGALLVSLDPGLAFEPTVTEPPQKRYGIKVGKAKPLGLGSVVASVSLEVLAETKDRYGDLSGAVKRTVPRKATQNDLSLLGLVDAYKDWARKQLGEESSWDELDFVTDLRRLLELPSEPSVRVYPTRFDQYGWLPKAGDRNGEPTGGSGNRPKAMKLARDL